MFSRDFFLSRSNLGILFFHFRFDSIYRKRKKYDHFAHLIFYIRFFPQTIPRSQVYILMMAMVMASLITGSNSFHLFLHHNHLFVLGNLFHFNPLRSSLLFNDVLVSLHCVCLLSKIIR